ncbi:M56 family metallopeptidase, partial [Singulisphaera rosea]
MNAGWATALALVAAISRRFWRHRPALIHSLWLLVLLKLATPSLVQFPAWWILEPRETRPVSPPQAFSIPAPLVVRTSEAIETPPVSRPSVDSSTKTRQAESVAPISTGRTWPLRTYAVGLWFTGVAWWCSVVALQAVRFRRLLRSARPAPEELQARIRRLAERLELRRTPSTWMVPARIPPMLWALFGPAKLLIPDELWGQLDDAQRETILVHELAHLKRLDHWVRRLEAVVLGLYWWDPVAWWARRELEEVEEQCCDAWVSWALPEAAEAYALALVAT